VRKIATALGFGLKQGRALVAGPIARASALSLAIRLAGLVLSFAQAVLTARLLGSTGYGTVATILSAAQLLSTAAMFGFGPLAVREIAARKAGGEEAALAGFLRLSSIFVVILSSVVAAIAVLAVMPLIGSGTVWEDGFTLGGLLVIPLALLALMRGWAQGFGRIANAQVPGEVLRPGIIVAVMGTAVAIGLEFGVEKYLVTAFIAASLASGFSFALLWQSDLRVLPAAAMGPGIWAAARTSLPFLGQSLAVFLQGEINTLLLAAFAGPHETGLFQPVARLAPLLTLPVQAASMRYAPRMSEFWRAGEHERIRDVTRTFTWTTSLLTLMLALAVAGAAPWLMLVFGDEFAASAPLLWIIAAAQVFNAAGGPLGVLFSMAGRTGIAVAGQLAGLAVNLAVGIIFIPSYGAMSAAFGILAATVTWNVVLIVTMRRKLGIDPSLFAFIYDVRRSDAT
jgi:O-antigen/teichoic acid export membrane protein